jgi:beta-glucosidase
VLKLKERLGLFEDPYRRGAVVRPPTDARALARDAARRAMVLLSHRRQVLPLSPETRHVALIGPLAAASGDMLGPWAAAGEAGDSVSMLAGLQAALPHCQVDTHAGVDISADSTRDIPAALERCRAAQLVILCLGESAAMSGEAASRADLGLPGCQRALAEAVLGLGKPVVVLLSSGRPLAVPWLFERADAVLATWFLGSEAGHAVAEVLTGKFNPAGRLPITWPRHGGQVPIFFGQRPTGRPSKPGERFSSSYFDVPETPQFPFGHGLSYAHFVLEDLRCVPRCVRPGESVEVSVGVHNDSSVSGECTLFLFLRDVLASIARPVLELKGVRKIVLAGGQRGRVTWQLPAESLAFVGPTLAPVLEAGRFDIHVGQSADPAGFLSGSIELVL